MLMLGHLQTPAPNISVAKKMWRTPTTIVVTIKTTYMGEGSQRSNNGSNSGKLIARHLILLRFQGQLLNGGGDDDDFHNNNDVQTCFQNL